MISAIIILNGNESGGFAEGEETLSDESENLDHLSLSSPSSLSSQGGIKNGIIQFCKQHGR